MKKITGYLPTTCSNMEHPRAKSMYDTVVQKVKEKGGDLKNMTVPEGGVAVLEITGEEAEKFITEALGKLPDVTVTDISPFEMDFDRNRKLQDKVNKRRAAKAAKSS